MFWPQVSEIPAETILLRTYLVLQAAARLSPHRHEPHETYLAGLRWQLRSLHGTGIRAPLGAAGIRIVTDPDISSRSLPKLLIRGFLAGSYAGTTLALVANYHQYRVQLDIGAIAMPPCMLMALMHLDLPLPAGRVALGTLRRTIAGLRPKKKNAQLHFAVK